MLFDALFDFRGREGTALVGMLDVSDTIQRLPIEALPHAFVREPVNLVPFHNALWTS